MNSLRSHRQRRRQRLQRRPQGTSLQRFARADLSMPLLGTSIARRFSCNVRDYVAPRSNLPPVRSRCVESLAVSASASLIRSYSRTRPCHRFPAVRGSHRASQRSEHWGQRSLRSPVTKERTASGRANCSAGGGSYRGYGGHGYRSYSPPSYYLVGSYRRQSKQRRRVEQQRKQRKAKVVARRFDRDLHAAKVTALTPFWKSFEKRGPQSDRRVFFSLPRVG